MVSVSFDGNSFELDKNESVLDCLTERGMDIPFGCRAGICQTCMMRAVVGKPPEAAQEGIKGSLRRQGYFLACVCYPDQDMQVALPDDAYPKLPVTVEHIGRLSADVIQVVLTCQAYLEYRPGQFIHVFKDNDLSRSYSIASVPELDEGLHLHVKRIAGGKLSGWMHEEMKIGQPLEIQGAMGDCFYAPGNADQALLLIGTGSGLAPLYGIARDALNQGHRGAIRLYHGSRAREGLYLIDELNALQQKHANFSYVPCLSGQAQSGFRTGRAHELALTEQPNLRNWKVFLCGHPDMVNDAKKKSFLAGAAFADIHADAFVISGR